MDYKKHLRKGFISIAKEILKEIALSDSKDFNLHITFLTDSHYVVVSDRIKWPDQMKILLADGSFEDLRIYDTFFEVVLFFDDIEELVKIPYSFILKIEDAEQGFELDLMDADEDKGFYITDENVINIDFEKSN